MGNVNEMDKEPQLTFYCQVKDQVLGTCDVYSSNKFLNCFIIKVIVPAHEVNQFELFTKIEDQQNLYLVSLYGYKYGKNCNCDQHNMVTDSVTSFWEYFTISLSDVLQQHKAYSLPFQQFQIWYIIKSCIFGYKAFERVNVSYDFQPSKLMINQDGRIRLQWMHIKDKNAHTHFYRKVKEGQSTVEEEQYFSPEQLWGICHKQFTNKLNPEKTNIFSLGMILLYCITLIEPSTSFYVGFQIHYQRINEAMNSSRCAGYSEILLKLIGWMINENPSERPTFGYIAEQYEEFMKRDDHIIMSENSHKEQKKMSISHKKIDDIQSY